MNIEYTLSIIKPDATARNLTGAINSYFEKAGLKIVAQKRLLLTKEMAEHFYAIHKERPFFNDLVKSITANAVVVQVLKGENAVARNREIMGATNPQDAAPGTIRKDFALSIEANSVHGSDSLENARSEVAYFFAGCEIVE
jgi:nucleoside-diphosphate kinase